MILCGSELRFALGQGTAPIIRLAGDAGFDGIAIGAGCVRGDVPLLTTAALSAGLLVPAVAAPLGDGPLGPGRRLPYLAAIGDGDERRAAVAAFTDTLETAVPFGVRLFTVAMGEVPLGTSFRQVSRRFARVELGEDEPGARLLRSAIGERRDLFQPVLDACRYALDRILPLAERRDAVLALEVAGNPWGVPGPREALALADEYSNGPIGLVWDEARMQSLRALGLGPSPDRRTALAAATRLWRANEAVGMEPGYLPGLGDPDGEISERAVPRSSGAPGTAEGAPIVVTGHHDSRAEEVARGRSLVASRS